jgi:hypothetical protein
MTTLSDPQFHTVSVRLARHHCHPKSKVSCCFFADDGMAGDEPPDFKSIWFVTGFVCVLYIDRQQVNSNSIKAFNI